MSFKPLLLAGACALLPSLAAAQMAVNDPYARAASPIAISGAAFMEIINPTEADDRVIAVTSEIAERAELHTHIQTDTGMMQMVHVEEGFPIPAGGSILLERGGMHVMFLGLRQPLLQGDEIEVTLEFESAEPLTVTIPVDLERMPARMGTGHGAMMQGSDG